MNTNNTEQDKKNIILATLVILIIILTLGLFFFKWLDKQQKAKAEDEQNLKQKKAELNDVLSQINELEPRRQELEEVERKIFIRLRIILGTLIIIGNLIYYLIWNFDVFKITYQVSINTAGILLYGLAMLMIDGDPNKFKSRLNNIITNYLREKNIHIWKELKALHKRKDELILEIEKIEQRIKNKEAISPFTTNNHQQTKSDHLL